MYLAASVNGCRSGTFSNSFVIMLSYREISTEGDNMDAQENVFNLSNVKCEPEYPPMEDERQTDISVMDFLQVKMEPQDDADGKCLTEQEKEDGKPCSGIEEVMCHGYQSNTSSYGQGRYSRRKSQLYKCKVGQCMKTFATWEETNAHLFEHDEVKRGYYACNVDGCRAISRNKKAAMAHAKTHLVPSKLYKCATPSQPLKKRIFCNFGGCQREFAEVSALLRHAHLHNGDKPYLCGVPCCTLRFASSEERDIHDAAHRNGGAFVCTFEKCGWVSSSHQHMQKHCKTVHIGDKPFKCSITRCGTRVSTKFLLDVHTRTHKLLRQYVCMYEGCDKRYKQAASLDMHLATHSSVKCTFSGCGDRFHDKEAMEKHAVLHTGDKPFLCTFDGCGERFSSGAGLWSHRRSHKTAMQQIKTKCGHEGCGLMVPMSFLKAHCARVHKTVTIYQCATEGCGETFETKRHYVFHMRRCQPKVNFICEFEGCNEEFSEESEFMKHYGNHAGAVLA